MHKFFLVYELLKSIIILKFCETIIYNKKLKKCLGLENLNRKQELELKKTFDTCQMQK